SPGSWPAPRSRCAAPGAPAARRAPRRRRRAPPLQAARTRRARPRTKPCRSSARRSRRREDRGTLSATEAAMRVLVTGAASGIGRATCLRLARDAKARGGKAKVAAVDLGPSPGLDGLVRELGELGAEVIPLHADMGTADDPGRVTALVIDRFGGLDG